MNEINQKLKEKIKIFDEIEKNMSNYSQDSNLENTDYLSNIKKTEEIKNGNNTIFNNIYSNFDLNDNSALYYTAHYSMVNNFKELDQKVINKTNNSSKNNTSYNFYNSSNKTVNNCNISLLSKKENKNKVIKKNNNNKKLRKNASVPKFSHQIKNIENDPEKFVETFFYNKETKPKKKETKKSHINENCRNREKENINNGNYTYWPKISKKSQEIANKLEPTSFRLFKKNKLIDKEGLEKITFESYKNLFKKIPYKSNQNHKNTKEKSINAKIEKLIKKLYDGGIQDLKKKELIYQENIMKKSEEYKNYPYQPNKDKKNKNNNNSINYSLMSLEQLNNDMYIKQIEWKNKKNEFNKKRKEFEEELFLSKNCPFKPDITHQYIKDDEKTIKRNLSDINNYIIKRRKQISNKKEKENKIYFRNNNSLYNKGKTNNSRTCFNLKLNGSKYFIGNNKNYVIFPRTDRSYFGGERGEFNSSCNFNKNKITNCSQSYFIDAVNALHNEILNLKI